MEKKRIEIMLKNNFRLYLESKITEMVFENNELFLKIQLRGVI